MIWLLVIPLVVFTACHFGFILPCHWITDYTVWGEPTEAINLLTGRKIRRKIIDGVLQDEWR